LINSLPIKGYKQTEEHKRKHAIARLGMKPSEETRIRMSLARIGFKQTEETKKKLRSINLGKKMSEECRQKMRLAQLGDKNNIWKGDDVTRRSLHKWLRDHMSQPKSCQKCNKKKKLDLANMTGVYNREFHNWKYLCRSCHQKYDYKPRPKDWHGRWIKG
jgi:NUMOD3 motif-containing protein